MALPISIWAVFGTRPEAIKMLPLVKKLKEDPRFNVAICITGQHKEMLDSVLSLFGETPDIDLGLMTPGQTLTQLSSRILTGMEEVILNPEKHNVSPPDRILVHGDTTTSFMTSLAAYYHQIPVGHVEAGLRTHDIYSPFPEEGNRQMTAVLADMHFAPTQLAVSNLLFNGVHEKKIALTGNTVIDALLWMKKSLKSDPSQAGDVQSLVDFLNDSYKKIVLITAHRRENHGDGFLKICDAISQLAEAHPKTAFVFPVHPNPNIKNVVYGLLNDIPNVHLVEPMEYAPFVYMMMHTDLILTDSGGIQEEAPSLGVPVLVMRESTERQEAVDAGTVILVGADSDCIVENANKLLTSKALREGVSQVKNPYGDGHACDKILNVIAKNHGEI